VQPLTPELLTAWEQQTATTPAAPYCYLFDGTVLSVMTEDTVYQTEIEAVTVAFLGSTLPKKKPSLQSHTTAT
jgi:hypothetical protein